jgi:hypothetical protein
MLQILGASCRHLEHLDIWKSTGVTDSGVAMLLGLEAEKPFRVCSTLRKVRPVEGGGRVAQYQNSVGVEMVGFDKTSPL